MSPNRMCEGTYTQELMLQIHPILIGNATFKRTYEEKSKSLRKRHSVITKSCFLTLLKKISFAAVYSNVSTLTADL